MEEQMVTISVKIPKALKSRIERSHMKVSTVVRNMLERKTLEEEAKLLNEESKKHKKLFEKLDSK